MNSFRAICVIYAALTWPLNGQEHNWLTPEEKAAELLFDGATTKGWRGLNDDSFTRSSWIVEDGALHSLGELPDNPWIDLVTTESFGDFELALDWKLSEKGNTGYLVQDLLSFSEIGSAPIRRECQRMLMQGCEGLRC